MTKWHVEGTRAIERVRDARRRQKREEQERQQKAIREQERRAQLTPRELALEQLDEIVVGQNISEQLAKGLAKALKGIDSGSNYEAQAIFDMACDQHFVTIERRGFFSHDVLGNLYLVIDEEAVVQHTATEALFKSWIKFVAQRVQSLITGAHTKWGDDNKAWDDWVRELKAVGVHLTDRPFGRIVTEDDVARTEEGLRRFVREREARSPSPGSE